MKHILSVMFVAILLSACGTEFDMHDSESELEAVFTMVQARQGVYCERVRFRSDAVTHDSILVCVDSGQEELYSCSTPWRSSPDDNWYICTDDDDIVPGMKNEEVEA